MDLLNIITLFGSVMSVGGADAPVSPKPEGLPVGAQIAIVIIAIIVIALSIIVLKHHSKNKK